jgi:hypothetical protein
MRKITYNDLMKSLDIQIAIKTLFLERKLPDFKNYKENLGNIFRFAYLVSFLVLFINLFGKILLYTGIWNVLMILASIGFLVVLGILLVAYIQNNDEYGFGKFVKKESKVYDEKHTLKDE